LKVESPLGGLYMLSSATVSALWLTLTTLTPMDEKLASIHYFSPSVQDQQQRQGVEMLTPQESAVVRSSVYGKRLSTATDKMGRRRVVIPTKLLELHKKKRLGVIRLLFDIVKGGRPVDALTSAGFSIALEENPVSALVGVDAPPELVDRV